MLDNWLASHGFWDEVLERRLDSEVQVQVISLQMEIQNFNFLSGIQLGVLLLMHTGNLSSTLQYTRMSCYKAQLIAKVHFSTFLKKLEYQHES